MDWKNILFQRKYLNRFRVNLMALSEWTLYQIILSRSIPQNMWWCLRSFCQGQACREGMMNIGGEIFSISLLQNEQNGNNSRNLLMILKILLSQQWLAKQGRGQKLLPLVN